MADLRIVDAPEIHTENITGEEKLPTGGSGNYSVTLDSVADFTKTKKDLADNTSVDGKVNGVRQELENHIEDLLNPHQVNKGQIGLGNVDNTADLDKPVSNSTQAAIISSVTPKADKTYVDGQLAIKANKVDVVPKSLTSPTYNTINSGVDPVTGVAEGAYFNVRSGDENTAATEYQNVGGSAIATGKIYLSALGVQAQNKSANTITDISGRSQQEINNITAAKVISILDFTGAYPNSNTPSDAAYAAAIASISDGDTLEIGFGTFIENDFVINKEINIVQKGKLWLHGDKGNAVKFTQAPAYTLSASTSLISLPAAGDSVLLLTPPAGVNLADYCFTLESTEVITNRLGFTDPYTKNEFNYFLTADGYLASSINMDYLDASKLTIKLYKKQRTREVRNLLPSIKPGTFTGATRDALVQESGVNNITYENCGIDKTNAESLGEGWAINRSGMNTYNSPIAIKTNKLGGNAYPFTGFIHGHNTFNNPKVILAANNHRGRFFASRHGSEIVFNGLAGSIDEHWGYKYSINDSTIYAAGTITFAGGTLKLTRVNRYGKNSTDSLVVLRADTPTAHGDLIFDSCNVVGPLFYANRSSNDPTKAIHRKSFDRIIIRDTSTEDHGYQVISLRGYNSATFTNDTRAQTELIVDNTSYSRVSDAGNGYGFVNNQIQAGWNVFSKVTLNGITPKVIGVDTVTTPYFLLRYLQADNLEIYNCDELSAIGLVVNTGKMFGGSLGNAKGGLDSISVAGKLDFYGVTINSDFLGMSVTGGTVDKIGYIGCIFNSDRAISPSLRDSISNLSGNTYGPNISSTLYPQDLDITNYTNPNRRKQLYSSVTLSSPLTIAAGARSAVRVASTVGARLGDFPQVSVAYAADISISAWISNDNATSYVLENKTVGAITLPTGTVINVWVRKP